MRRAPQSPSPRPSGPGWVGGGGRGTQRRGGAPASPPRSGLGAAGRRAAAAGKRGGGGGCRVRQGPTLTRRPLAAARGTAGPRTPLCDMCCRPGLHERGGHFAVSSVPALFSTPWPEKGDGNWRKQTRSSNIAKRKNDQHAIPTTSVEEATLYPGLQPRGLGWGRGGKE